MRLRFTCPAPAVDVSAVCHMPGCRSRILLQQRLNRRVTTSFIMPKVVPGVRSFRRGYWNLLVTGFSILFAGSTIMPRRRLCPGMCELSLDFDPLGRSRQSKCGRRNAFLEGSSGFASSANFARKGIRGHCAVPRLTSSAFSPRWGTPRYSNLAAPACPTAPRPSGQGFRSHSTRSAPRRASRVS